MKKLTAILLVVIMLFSFAACGAEETSQDESSEAASQVDESSEVASEPPTEESSQEPTEETSEEPTEESSEEPADPVPDFLANHYVYVNGISAAMTATSGESIRLTKINEQPEYGDVVLFTYSAFKKTIAYDGETYEDYAILIVEYVPSKFKYLKKEIIEADSSTDKSAIAIPEDGFVVAIHKVRTTEIAKLAKIKDDVAIYAAGIQTKEIYWELNKVNTPFTIDGTVGDEWSSFLIEEIDETNPNWDYSQFAEGDYDRFAELYAAYDDDYFYFAVVVYSPDCVFKADINESNKSAMYSWESIQMNFMNVSSQSQIVAEHYNHHIDQELSKEGYIRQYGFSGSNDGTSYSIVYMAKSNEDKVYTGDTVVVRDEDKTTTTYEIRIPWAELGIEDISQIDEASFSISINSSVDTSRWQNIRMRDGGGIIGINDFTKMPVLVINH